MNISSYIQSTPSITGSDEKNKIFIVIIIALTIFIIVGLVMIKSKPEPAATSFFEESRDKLEQCGWELYISMTCPYCIKQKNILTQNFPKFTKIYTDKPVNVVPTWYNTKTKQKREGLQTYEDLLNMIVC